MKNTIIEIEKNLSDDFKQFFKSNSKDYSQYNLYQRDYYYITNSFFTTELGLKFNLIHFTTEEIETINKKSENYFSDDSISFKLNYDNRNSFKITNLRKIFNSKTNIIAKEIYIREFIFYNIMTISNIDINKIKVQRINFIISYLEYLMKHNKNPLYLENFIYYKNLHQTKFKKIKKIIDSNIKELKELNAMTW